MLTSSDFLGVSQRIPLTATFLPWPVSRTWDHHPARAQAGWAQGPGAPLWGPAGYSVSALASPFPLPAGPLLCKTSPSQSHCEDKTRLRDRAA